MRKGVRAATLAVAALIALLSVGGTFAAWQGYWPPKSLQPVEQVSVTPTSANALGLKVAKAGPPRNEGGQWIVPVQITNNVRQSPPAQGTVSPGAAAPGPVPATVLNASVKVLFYDRPASDPGKKIVGTAVGNYVNPTNVAAGLAPGATDKFDVIATGVGDFKDYEVFPDNVWTDKDPVKKSP